MTNYSMVLGGRFMRSALAALLVVTVLVPALPAAAAAAAVSGTVTEAGSGTPVAGVDVYLYDYDWDEVAQTTTNASGAYSFGTLPGNGVYYLEFYAQGYGYDSIEFTYTGVSLVRNMALERLTPIVTGVVSDSATHDPIEGAWLMAEVYDPEWDYYEWIGDAESGPDGTYTIYDEWSWGADDFTIWVQATAYRSTTVDITWNGSGVVTRDIALDPAAAIATGVVRDAESGEPIEDAVIEAGMYDPVEDGYAWAGGAYTDAEGRYTLYDEDGLGAGEYDIHAWAWGYREQMVTGDWDGVAVLTRDFALEPRIFGVVEVAGATRYETSVKSSQLAFPEDNSCETVIIASGRNFPDALGGSALAGALQAPVLLTAPGTLPGVVADEIGRLGATDVVIIGGTAAVSEGVETALNALPGVVRVDRIAGQSRYETAALVAEEVVGILGPEYGGHVMFATGTNFPDALAAAPLATQGIPILLVRQKSIPDDTMAAIDSIKPDFGLVLGGTSAVSGTVYGSLETKLGGAGTIDRIAGISRYQTAAMIAEYGIWEYGLDPYGMGLATGTTYPDALAGGAAQGLTGTVLLLTRPTVLDPPTAGMLYDWGPWIDELRYFGGPAAISDWVRWQAEGIVAP